MNLNHRIRPAAGLLLAFLFVAAPLVGQEVTPSAGNGTVAFRLTFAVEAAVSQNRYGFVFRTLDSHFVKVLGRADGKLTLSSLLSGNYRLSEIVWGTFGWSCPGRIEFEVVENEVSYIGDFQFGTARSTRVEDGFQCRDRSVEAIREISASLPHRAVRSAVVEMLPSRPSPRALSVPKVNREDATRASAEFPGRQRERKGVVVFSFGIPRLDSVGSSVSNEGVHRAVLLFRRNDAAEGGGQVSLGDGVFRSSRQDLVQLSEFSEGRVHVLLLNPGAYEFFNVIVTHPPECVSTLWFSEDFSLPFAIAAGETVYLGEIFLRVIEGRDVPFLTTSAHQDLHISDQWTRDQAIATESHPFLTAVEPRKQILRADPPWDLLIVPHAFAPPGGK